MRIIAVDPGLTIGLAFYDSLTEDFKVDQCDNPFEAIGVITGWSMRYDPDALLVEDYQSGGHLTKEAKETIKLVGFFSYWGTLQVTWTETVAPQARLSSVVQATKLLSAEDLSEMHRNGRDAVAALAHAISYARRSGD